MTIVGVVVAWSDYLLAAMVEHLLKVVGVVLLLKEEVGPLLTYLGWVGVGDPAFQMMVQVGL